MRFILFSEISFEVTHPIVLISYADKMKELYK